MDQAVMSPPAPVAIYGVLPPAAAPNWSLNVELVSVKVFKPSVKLYESGVSTDSSGVAQSKLLGSTFERVIEPVTPHSGGQLELNHTLKAAPE